MSYLSKKTGRPRKPKDFQRINVIVDKPMVEALRVTGNRSEYIRYCVNNSVYSKRVRFSASETTVNSDCHNFATAMHSEWVPCDSQNNAILLMACYFNYNCVGKGFRFRLSINGKVSSSIKVSANNTWGFSQVYTNSSFKENVEIFPNLCRYSIDIQVRPLDSSSIVAVKDLNVILDVIDGMSPYEWNR